MAGRAGFGSISARDARALLNSVAGIAIYRDRFRIRPYGDNDNDWLTLDKRRVQNPTMCIGHNQVSGILVIDNEIRSGLVERSSREGLEENGSLRRLRRLITELLAKKIEPRRFDFREDTGLGRQRRDTLSDAYKIAQLRQLEDFVAALPEPARTEGVQAVSDAATKLTGYLEFSARETCYVGSESNSWPYYRRGSTRGKKPGILHSIGSRALCSLVGNDM